MRFRRFSKTSEKENLDFEDNIADEVFESDENLKNQTIDSSDMLTLEGLRRTYNSCSNCGVSWYDEHVSLDCSECGGYSLSRPCPTCNGQCGNKWRRDVKASRVKKQAQWHGICSLTSVMKTSIMEPKLSEDNANYRTTLTQNLVHPNCILNSNSQ